MTVEPSTAAASSEYENKTYLFCCPSCKRKFDADPRRYVYESAPRDSSVAPPAQPGTQVEYTCPMHPEVVSDRPGSCPKCGMALEPRVAGLEEGPDPELLSMQRRFWIGLILSLPVF